MDIPELRTAFRRFAGEARFRKFVRAVSQAGPKKGRLFYWQERLWNKFVSTVPEASKTQDEILRAFSICDLHGCELQLAESSESPAEVRETPEYAEAFQALFPLAVSRHLVCPQCRLEREL